MRLLNCVLGFAALLCIGCSEQLEGNAISVLDKGAETDLTYPSAGMTYLHWDKGHGYQVTYYDEGHVWLWYPGNRAALRGTWTQEEIAGESYLCFTYPRTSYNPVTGLVGGQRECRPQTVTNPRVVDVRSGDIFHLASGAVPYVLKKNQKPRGF